MKRKSWIGTENQRMSDALDGVTGSGGVLISEDIEYDVHAPRNLAASVG